MYGHVVQGRAYTASLRDLLINAWIEPVTDIFKRQGMSPAQSRVHARLNIATVHGAIVIAPKNDNP